MNYNSLISKLSNLKQNYSINCLGKTYFKRKIFAVEKIIDANFPTAILVGGTHAREHITTSLLIKMLEEKVFDKIRDFNISVIPILNPDGVELSQSGLLSVPKCKRQGLLKINGGNEDFSLWKANARGVDLNNNFDANFGTNVGSNKPAPSGFVGKRPESERETRIVADFVREKMPFILLSYHSKGEEIYFNFFQEGKRLERDEMVAKKFARSTGYIIKNPEKSSSGGLKDYCVDKLKIMSLTLEVGSDELCHPITENHLDEIFERHKNVACDLDFAYNVFRFYREKYGI